MPAVGNGRVEPTHGPHDRRHLHDDGHYEVINIRHSGNWVIHACLIGTVAVPLFAYAMWYLFSHMH